MDQVDDQNDSCWDQQQQDERSQSEQQMLTDDPEYHIFCLTYEANSELRTH